MPWATGHSFDQFGTEHFTRPWYAPEDEGEPHTYKHISVVAPPCYDTNHPNYVVSEAEHPFNAVTSRYQVNFNTVPEEETTWRAYRPRTSSPPTGRTAKRLLATDW